MTDQHEPFGGFGGFAPEPPSDDEHPAPDATSVRIPPAGEAGDVDETDQADQAYEPYDDEGQYDLAQHRSHRAEPPHRMRWGAVAAGVIVLVVIAAVVVGGAKGVHFLKDHLHHSAADYAAGQAHGHVLFEVHTGDTATDMGRSLLAKGVVESTSAFIKAAEDDPKSTGIQVGYYELQKKMSSAAVLAVLENPKNLVQSLVTVPEGARVDQVIAEIAAHTKISRSSVVTALKHPSDLHLPSIADGDPEGFLWPATYAVTPGETAVTLLRQMVAKAVAEDASLGVAKGAKHVGLTPRQVITVASILEYEAKRNQDYPKVARAIYNRLKAGMPIQSDATVAYANGLSGSVWTSPAERQSSSPYNTYNHTGLPPGPIGSPGATTIEAALHPAKGAWLYWVVVNLKTGETVMSDTLAEHNQAIQQLDHYCQTESASHCK